MKGPSSYSTQLIYYKKVIGVIYEAYFWFLNHVISVLIIVNNWVFKFWLVIIATVIVNDGHVYMCLFESKYSTHYTSGVSFNSNASQKLRVSYYAATIQSERNGSDTHFCQVWEKSLAK